MPDKNIEAGLDSNFFSVIRMKLNFCANKNCTFKPSVAFQGRNQCLNQLIFANYDTIFRKNVVLKAKNS